MGEMFRDDIPSLSKLARMLSDMIRYLELNPDSMPDAIEPLTVQSFLNVCIHVLNDTLEMRSVTGTKAFGRSRTKPNWVSQHDHATTSHTLIGNFDFTTASSEVDMEAIAARYQNEDFWRCSRSEGEAEGPQ